MISKEKLKELNGLKKEVHKQLPDIIDKLNNILEVSLEYKKKSMLFENFYGILSRWFRSEDQTSFDITGGETSTDDTHVTREYTRNILIRFPIVECLLQNIYGTTEITKDSKFGKLCRQFVGAILGSDNIRNELSSIMDYGIRVKQIIADADSKSCKQEIIAAVFEHLFTSFNSKESDVHGVVYTPDEVTEFMVESVNQCLINEFGITQGINAENVRILDPCAGTGNFEVALLEKQNEIAEEYNTEVVNNVTSYEISLLSCYVSEVVLGEITSDLSRVRKSNKTNIRWCDALETLQGSDVVDDQFPLI